MMLVVAVVVWGLEMLDGSSNVTGEGEGEGGIMMMVVDGAGSKLSGGPACVCAPAGSLVCDATRAATWPGDHPTHPSTHPLACPCHVGCAGALSDGDDVAALLSASWRVTRRLVLKKNGVPEFHFRQYLFASQARVLLKLRRPVDVAERGLHFVQVGPR